MNNEMQAPINSQVKASLLRRSAWNHIQREQRNLLTMDKLKLRLKEGRDVVL